MTIDYKAARDYNARLYEEVETTNDFADLVAHWQRTHGLDADGKFGTFTLASVRAARAAAARAAATKPAPAYTAPPVAEVTFDGPLSRRPVTVADLNAAYGDPTRGGLYLKVADPVWEKQHLRTLEPGSLTLVFSNGPGRYVTVNEAVVPYLVEGLRRAESAWFTLPAGDRSRVQDPKFRVGGYNFRRMRHDTPERAKAEGRPLRPLSRHAWGAAVDVDADNNAAREFPAGGTPLPWSPEWRAVWPRGLEPWFVLAMESVGFRWGGRWRGFCDPMHFELCGGDDVAL